MQVVMANTVSIAPNSTDPNVLDGEIYERSPVDATGTLYQTGSATGLLVSLNVGGFQVADRLNVGAANAIPKTDEDMIIDQWKAPEGILIKLAVENTTGGALTYQFRIPLDDNPALYAAT